MAPFGQRTVSLLFTLFCAMPLVLSACTNAPAGTPVIREEEADLPPVKRSMRVATSFGGAHRDLLIDGNHWFQTFANRLLILDAQTGTTISDVELAPRGTTGPATSLVLRGQSMFVVLDGDAVVELEVDRVRRPVFVARWGVPELGITPRQVSLVDGEILVSGDGGVVRLADAPREGTTLDKEGKPLPPVPPVRYLDGLRAGTVVAAEGGPVACVGRRILRVRDGSYLGAASRLFPLPAEYGGGYGFALQASDGAEVGLMTGEFRERSRSAVRGEVRSLRVFDGRFLAVTDTEVTTWKLETTPGPGTISDGEGIQLGTMLPVAVRGARDVGIVRQNRFAVAGSFGRALYRYLPEGDKPGDTFYWTERMPGRLDVSVSDRRRVLAVGVEGAWMYLIGEKAELVDRDIASPDRQSPAAEVAWGSASCDERRQDVQVRVGETLVLHRPSRGGLVSTLAAADGRIWVGHDDGIDVLGLDPATGNLVVEDRIVLAGPIVAIYPNRVGGGVNYVARLDGFGVIRPIPVDDPPIVTPGTIMGFPAPSKPDAAKVKD